MGYVGKAEQCLQIELPYESSSLLWPVATVLLKMPSALCRFSWLMEHDPESLQPWTGTKTDSLLQKQLPLQKMLVPARSIPVRG